MFEVVVEQTFAAAHALRNYHGTCENLHGHNFRVEVTVAGEQLDEAGMLVDFLELKDSLSRVIARLDHQNLNELPPFDALNPSAENLARYICEETGKAAGASVKIAKVKVWETATAAAVYRPK